MVLAAAGVVGVPRRAAGVAWTLSSARGVPAARRCSWALQELPRHRSRPILRRRRCAARPRRLPATPPARSCTRASPYVFDADKTFAYPPFLAWLARAAARVRRVAAAVRLDAPVARRRRQPRSGCSSCATGAATRSRSSSCSRAASIDLGTIEPLLLLAVAAAWRWRDASVAGAARSAAAIVLKLFLWPLAVWLALTRRVCGRPVVAVAVAVALTFMPLGGDRLRRARRLPRRSASARATRSRRRPTRSSPSACARIFRWPRRRVALRARRAGAARRCRRGSRETSA